jgi:hypothetical protein
MYGRSSNLARGVIPIPTFKMHIQILKLANHITEGPNYSCLS